MKRKLPLLLCTLMSFSITGQQVSAQVMALFMGNRMQKADVNPASSFRPSVANPLTELKADLSTGAAIKTVQKQITGNVTDENGNAVSGVSVSIKGTAIGTTTDANGRFSLTVPDDRLNDGLLFSSVGFEDQQVAIGSQSVINVVLIQNVSTLTQVVVVGYGTQRRTAVTAAISSVAMKEIKDMPVSNVATALQGKIPGIIVQQNNGAPGSTPAIKVRGLGSISAGNSPLIVVDGNIVSPNIFSLLNSNEILSIDVLKDASSTAIYGSRGSNGVIIVTTRRGKTGKTNINLDVFTGFQEVTKKIGLLNSLQMAELSKEAANNAYLDNVPAGNVSDPNNLRPVLRYRYPRGEAFPWLNFDDQQKIAELPDHDFQDLIFRKASISNYQLSVSGVMRRLSSS